jgi:hydroxypyruvate isomerase
MTRLAANLTMMFQELPFLDRIDAAAAAGFSAIECVMPYVASPGEIAERLQRHDLTMALFNMPPGDWAAGERGFGADPSRVEDFAASIDTTIEYAEATGCKTVHLMAGKIPADADHAQWNAILVHNIRRAAEALMPKGIAIVLEPINTRVDIPGYFYDTTAAVLAVIDEAGVEGVKLLYDIYHMQIMEGDLARTIERLLPRIGHIQLADNPGRNEPGSGEINYPWLLSRLDALGYAGWVGCEYKPAGETVAGLGWAKPYLD